MSLMEVLGAGIPNRGSRMHPFHALQQPQTWPVNGHYLTCMATVSTTAIATLRSSSSG